MWYVDEASSFIKEAKILWWGNLWHYMLQTHSSNFERKSDEKFQSFIQ